MNKSITLFFFILFSFCHITVFSQCNLKNIDIQINNCYESELFSVNINFEYNEIGNNGFLVLGNGTNYGTFQYTDLPITIDGLLGDCSSIYDFIIRDIDNPLCNDFANIDPICCNIECDISITDITTECSNDSVIVSFDIETIENNGQYVVWINDELLGDYNYTDLPSVIEFENNDNQINSITVCDIYDNDCCSTFSVDNPCVCSITNITSEIIDCDDINGTFNIILDFDNNQSSDSFLLGNTANFLGTFGYNQLPVSVGPIAFSNQSIEVLILDQDDVFCFNAAYLGAVQNCEINCQIYNVFGEAYNCENGQYYIDVSFETSDISNNYFDILVDGINYGTYEHGQPQYTVGPIPSSCTVAPTIVIQDALDVLCQDFYNFPDPICCIDTCQVADLNIIQQNCIGEVYNLEFSFTNKGMIADSFVVMDNAINYGTYAYGDSTYSIGPIVGACSTNHLLTIYDQQDISCSSFTNYTSIDCCDSCLLDIVNVAYSDCEDETFFAYITFDYSGDVSDSFSIIVNNDEYGQFPYGLESYEIGPLDSNCDTMDYLVEIADTDIDCNLSVELNSPICCADSICVLSDIVVAIDECIDSQFYAIITFDYIDIVSDSFIVNINGNLEYAFAYGDESYTVGPLFGDCMTIYQFEIVDQLDNNCNIALLLEDPICCDVPQCEIDNLSYEIIDCDDENGYEIVINFDHTEGTSDSFRLNISGMIHNSYSYNDLPVTLLNIPAQSDILLSIIDQNNDNCTTDLKINLPHCEVAVKDEVTNLFSIQYIQTGFIINSNYLSSFDIATYNINGQLVSSMNGNRFINMTDNQAGIYILKISNGQRTETYKIVWCGLQ